jgi:hypothetical protein
MTSSPGAWVGGGVRDQRHKNLSSDVWRLLRGSVVRWGALITRAGAGASAPRGPPVRGRPTASAASAGGPAAPTAWTIKSSSRRARPVYFICDSLTWIKTKCTLAACENGLSNDYTAHIAFGSLSRTRPCAGAARCSAQAGGTYGTFASSMC